MSVTGGDRSSPDPRIDARHGPLTIARKARLTAGAGYWTTWAEPQIDLPALRMSDGANGVRGVNMDERETAWCTPCGTGLAATWDAALVRRIGGLIGDEARRKQVDIVLGPVVNIPRSPLGGRGFECYSEDPFLSGRMAAAWIDGVQSRGIAACPKHFVANDSETSRTTVSCVVDERTLREIYLLPFEMAVKSGAWALMAAYNRVNGLHATEHHHLIHDVLKVEWQWDGLVLSDWYGAHDTVRCAQAGLDLEMPGPPKVFGPQLAAAVEAGTVSESVVDDKVRRLRRLAERIRAARSLRAGVDIEAVSSAHSIDSQAELLTDAAADGFTLLKNDAALLPIAADHRLRRLAVIGPNAWQPCYQGGGSATVNMRPGRTPFECLRAQYPDATVRLERGCEYRASPPGLHELDLRVPGQEHESGLAVEFFADGRPPDQPPTFREVRNTSFFTWFEGLPGPAALTGILRVSTVLVPERDGVYTFTVRGSERIRMWVDEQLIASQDRASMDDPLQMWFSDEHGLGTITLTANQPVLVQVEMYRRAAVIPMLDLGCIPPEAQDLATRAVALARESDAVILLVGTNADFESESTDRSTTSLPGAQDALVEAVLAANPATVVVINAGAAVDMPWVEQAPTILYGWFPGHGFGPALASVISGEREPGGRLPITLGAAAEDYPVHDISPGPSRTLVYRESVFVGYRHFDAASTSPAFCFGHGLGYTCFSYDDLRLSESAVRAGDGLTVTVTVRNRGARRGKAVVQLYVSPAPCDQPRPPRELKAFAAVRLDPGESARVELGLDARSFAFWDSTATRWHVEPGVYGIHVGRSSRDLALRASVRIS